MCQVVGSSWPTMFPEFFQQAPKITTPQMFTQLLIDAICPTLSDELNGFYEAIPPNATFPGNRSVNICNIGVLGP